MDRWEELERLGKLRADGLLSDEEFEVQKGRLLHGDIPQEVAEPDEQRSGVPRWALIAGVLLLTVLLIWLFMPSTGTDGNSSGVNVQNTAVADVDTASAPMAHALRSNVNGASLVRLDALPSTTAYGDNSDDYCGERIAPATTGGELAARNGWRVVQEEKFGRLDAVLIVRGFDPMTSGRCASKDANIAFFDGEKFVGVLFAKGKNAIDINSIELVAEHLRVWSTDPAAQGQVNLSGTELTFDPVTGSDAVCDGKYRVPVVFNKSYSEARRILANSGWIATPSTEEVDEGDRTADYRLAFPEVDSCAGTGYAPCSFTLTAQDGVAKLHITTLGENADPGVSTYEASCEGKPE